ncbi:MAG TPA: YkgJ family cysteine cluster protein [Xanthomonadales bacterium]|nr:YkgJ family cysteine cluster protein [Xanthomonadales bacterium]
MSSKTEEGNLVTANARIAVGSQRIDLKLVVPADEVPPEALVETLQQFTNIIIDGVESRAQENGLKIACKKGCGACCRQLVPISRPEARLLAQLVEDMPEPRRSQVRTRFEDAVRRLAESGLGSDAINFHLVPNEDRMELGKSYFDLGIACPFLEDESCSIHQQRPLVCREYLVVSSPKHCATLDGDNIKRLKIPASVSSAFSRMEGTHQQGDNPYVPLILALAWVEAKGSEFQLKPGTEWVQQFFEDVSGKPLPDEGDTMLP